MKLKNTNNKIKSLIITVLGLFFILSAVLTCIGSIREHVSGQITQNLTDVAGQHILTLENQIDNNKKLLYSAEAQLRSMSGSMEDNITELKSFAEAYGLKRLGYCDSSGIAHSTDGVTADLSFRDFFQRGMQGLYTVTGVLEDTLGDEHGQITVISAPMTDPDGTVSGVFFLTYDSEDFNRSMQIDSFEGAGFDYVFSENGEIMVANHSPQGQISENLFTDILLRDRRNDAALIQIHQDIKEGSVSQGTVYFEEECSYYCLPVFLLDEQVTWYVMTVVPTQYISKRIAPIEDDLVRMLVIILLIVFTASLFFFIFSHRQRRNIMKLAYADSITGGDNYALFCRKLQQSAPRKGYFVAVSIADYRSINAAVGSRTGSELLREVWRLLCSRLDADEYAAHTGEDNFVMFLEGSDQDQIIRRLTDLEEQFHNLSARMAIPLLHPWFGLYAADSRAFTDDCCSKATQAKDLLQDTRNHLYAFYSESDHERRMQDHYLLDIFNQALADHQFEVWYQPKYDPDTAEIVGAEALVRWRDEEGKLISPGRFIPLLENSGDIVRLDEYMFREVCSQQKKWLQSGRSIPPVSINLSRASLYYENIVDKYLTIIKEYDLDPSYIQLEVTESVMMGNTRLSILLEKFRQEGVKILMDDFGTGYSSLSALTTQCFDTIKLDKSLIDHIGDPSGDTMLYHVVQMAHHLGMQITAEGVESSDQLKYLQKLHCDDIQGYYFSRPVPIREYEKKL